MSNRYTERFFALIEQMEMDKSSFTRDELMFYGCLCSMAGFIKMGSLEFLLSVLGPLVNMAIRDLNSNRN